MRVKQLVFWTALVVIALGLAEAVARVYRAVAGDAVRTYGYPTGLYVHDEALDYGLQPGFRGTFSDTGYSEIDLEINTGGHRDREFSAARAPRERRIVLLGDSVAFGSGVLATDRFSDLLETLAPDDAPLDVVNLAVNSYTFFHYREQVRRDVARFDPAVVLIAFCLNDIAPRETSGPRNVVLPEGDAEMAARIHREVTWRDRLEKVSAVAWLARELVDVLRRPSRQRAWDLWIERVEEAWRDEALVDRLREDLDAVATELHRQDRQLAVLVLPERHELDDPTAHGEPRRRLLELLEARGIPWLDLQAEFARAESTGELFLPSDAVHLSPRGHATAAEAIGRFLRAGGLLGAR